jgi:aquaporin Z
MDPDTASLPLWTKAANVLAPLTVEFIGTFFLVASIGFNSLNNVPAAYLAPFGIGFTLVVVVFAGGHISGAHYNPAVTLAVWVSRRKKISGLDAIMYVLTQVFAAFMGGLFYWAIKQDTFLVEPAAGVDDGRAFAVEVVWTFLLATVVLQTATTETQAGNSFFGLSIGLTVAAGAITVGPISGGVFNPAVGTGVLVVHALRLQDSDHLQNLWIYWVGPLLGGLLAGINFWFTNRREFHEPGQDMGSEHLFSADVRSVADVSAQKREGGKILKDIIKREMTASFSSPDELSPMINSHDNEG